jgi:cytochrome d ubiquinol oxidase subunit II
MATLLAAAMALALVAYALTGGADFGAGILLVFSRKRAHAALIEKAIAPIWEANHVWLIFIVVVMFAAFPPAFALLTVVLHVPLTLMLIAIVLRGAAFVFQVYDPNEATRVWPRVFALASVAAPIFLGVSLGAVASGAVTPSTDFVSAWWRPFPWAVGVFVAALFTMLAAVYLCREAERELREDFRRRALVAEVVAGATALLALLAARDGAPALFNTLACTPLAWLFQAFTALVSLAAIAALWRRLYTAARVLAIGQVVLVVAGLIVAQYPALIPPTLTIANSAAEPQVLEAIAVAAGAGSLLLAPAFVWLFIVFKAPLKSRARAAREKRA